MLEEASLRKLRTLLASANKLPPWSSQVSLYGQEQVRRQDCQDGGAAVKVHEVKALTLSLLNFMSGGEPSKLLEVGRPLKMLKSHQEHLQNDGGGPQVCLDDASKKDLLSSAGTGKTRQELFMSSCRHHPLVQAGQDQHGGE